MYKFQEILDIQSPVRRPCPILSKSLGRGHGIHRQGFGGACIIRKTTSEGTLKVEIIRGKDVVSTSETAAPFGVITLGKIPDTTSIINQLIGKILG